MTFWTGCILLENREKRLQSENVATPRLFYLIESWGLYLDMAVRVLLDIA